MTTVYISGSITDGGTLTGQDVQDRLAAFHQAAMTLRLVGYTPINPARNEGKADDWLGYMRLALVDLSKADAVAQLPGWEKSRGAVVERDIALALGIGVVSLETLLAGTRR